MNVKKMFRKVTKKGTPFLFNFDTCTFANNILLVRGWAFVQEDEIEELKLMFKTSSETKSITVEQYGIERIDVGRAFNSESANNSGFQGEYELSFDETVEMSIIAKTKSGIYQEVVQELSSETKGVDLQIANSDTSILHALNNLLEEPEIYKKDNRKVDVIVPVYNGYDYLEKLFEGLQKTDIAERIIIINDCSPDGRVAEKLAEFKEQYSKVELLTNEKNLGFVKTVNRALRMATRDVVLVNTDVELPDMWLERLMKPIFENEKVASTTPFSNSATIFSFPNFGRNNVIYHGMDVDEIDSYFCKIIPKYTIVPTGVGFCMGMSYKAIQEIGVLDDVTFVKGYGEENDWCQRAIKAGYINVHVENLFVYHKHGGSFPSAEKNKLMKENGMKLIKKHPNYQRDVSAYCSLDPVKRIRHLVQLLISTNKQKNILYFDHCLGGGATAYVDQRIAELKKQGINCLIIRYDYLLKRYKFLFINDEITTEYTMDEFEEVFDIFNKISLNCIYLNELVSYPELFDKLEMIVKLKNQANAKLVMLMHDYFSLCPSINLLSTDYEYCEEGKKGNCNDCFNQFGWKEQYGCESINDWKKEWKNFLQACDEVRTFSQDSKDRVERSYGQLNNITLVPHKVNYLFPLNRRVKTTKTLNIGLLGILSEHKGKTIVNNLLHIIKDRGLDVKIILIGAIDGEELDEDLPFEYTGKYEVHNLPVLILEKDIDVFLVPAIWPETFSYTTEEIIKMHMPIVSYPIGAPTERIERYELGHVLESKNNSDVLDEIINFVGCLKSKPDTISVKKNVLCIAEQHTFSTRYRMEHLQEQLLCGGYRSKLVCVDELHDIKNVNEFDVVVIYRCAKQRKLIKFLKRLNSTVPILYDTDDYIFNYDRIKELQFLKTDEYSEFKKYSSKVRECMQSCDGFLTSTDTLASAISEEFGKDVFVNRNLASMSMRVFSEQALLYKKDNKSDVVIGYFSGSKTHDSDFEMIEDSLIKIMDNYPNVQLMLVGCMNISDKFNRFSGRIVEMDFVPWQMLPRLIADTDINLMPLCDTYFNLCKSENKWMEAAFVKTVTIASYNEEINKVTNNNKNIILCRNKEEWYEKLELLVKNKELRKQLASAAYDYVTNNKMTNTVNVDVINWIESFIKL